MTEVTTTHSEAGTQSVAETFARRLQRGDVVALYGDLGSGKTQFVKGLTEAFRSSTHATSPSFVLLNRYEGKDAEGRELLLYHFDLYRVRSAAELYDIGFEEYLRGNGISFIEWAENVGDLLPESRYDIRISPGDAESERRIEITSTGIPER